MTETTRLNRWQTALQRTPLIAILRGITPQEAEAVGRVLIKAGITIAEVPLNSPDPLQTIEILQKNYGSELMVGAGTVLSPLQVNRVVDAGGELIVAPNFDISVAVAAIQKQAIYCPGIATPTEAFAAINAGANALKLFPAELITPSVVKAMRAVLPKATMLLPVGGITTDNMQSYFNAGANGFGIGSALYKPGTTLDALQSNAVRFVEKIVVSR